MWQPDKRRAAILASALTVAACGGNQGKGDGGLRLDERLGPGEVRAGVVTTESELLEGVEAHGWLGDFKLYNHRVAFIVQGIEDPRGWGYHGGTLLDADRVREEGQPGREMFQELILNVDLQTMAPTAAEVVSDGSAGGPALVRVEGTHRGLPLIDGALGGALQPKKLRIVQEYILEADADFLRVRTELSARQSTGIPVEVGDLVLNGDLARDFLPGPGMTSAELPAGEYAYHAGVHPDGCTLYTGVDAGIHVMLSVEGVTPSIAAEGTAPPVRGEEEPLAVERLLIVGDGGLDSCLRILQELRGETSTGRLTGSVRTSGGGPVAGASVLVCDQMLASGACHVDQTYTDEAGGFSLQLPAGDYRLEVRAAGRDPVRTDPVALAAGDTQSVEVEVPPEALLAYHCEGRDLQGEPTGPLPCKISLQAGHGAPASAAVHTPSLAFGVTGQGLLTVPAGEWTVTLSRGMEYTIHREDITATPGETASVSATLQRQVDTGQAVAADLHSHCTRSADSEFRIDDKIASNICEGVELLVITDHDCQTDYTPFLEQMRQRLSFDPDVWIRTVTGNEVSPLYAHMTVFPLPVHPTGWNYWDIPWTLYQDGAFVRNLEFPELWQRARELGARIINVAHPLESSGYFNYLGFDPPGEMPRLEALPADKYGTGFDTIELLNSGDVDEMLERIVPLWCALNNQGVFRTAVGVSDSHGRTSEAGFGRTMVTVADDDPARLDLEQVWTALAGRRAMVAGGIFVYLQVGDALPGDLVGRDAPFEVELRVEAADWVPVGQVELLANGEVVASLELLPPGQVDPARPAVRLAQAVTVDPAVDTWYAAVASGPPDVRLDPVFRGRRAVGMTNAVQVDVDGDGAFTPPGR